MRTRKVIGSICFFLLINALSHAQTSLPSLSANSNTMVTRSPDSRGWTDPALNHNRLLRDQLGDGTYTLIGIYKVKGSPYLFGGKHNGDLFSPKEKAYNIEIRYNAYNQEVEFYSTSNSTPLVKTVGEVDSFIIKQDIASGITNDLRFIYGQLIGSSEKAYFQLVESGDRFSLYKRYKADIKYVSENYIQSELRQFELESGSFIPYSWLSKALSFKQPVSARPRVAKRAEAKNILFIFLILRCYKLIEVPENTACERINCSFCTHIRYIIVILGLRIQVAYWNFC